MTDYANGTPIWVDLSTSDTEAAAAFYGDLFGWTTTEANEEFGGYQTFMQGESRIAGLGPLMEEGQPIVWSTYIQVEDAAATGEKVTAAGGQVMVPPMAIGDLGTMAFFIDTVGAIIGVWQPGEHRGAELVNEPVSLSWNELTCAAGKAAAASDFYGAVFGWTSTSENMGPMEYTMFRLGDNLVAGMIGITDPSHADLSFWNVYFSVADCDATTAKTAELGGKQLRPAMDIPPGRFAILQDPQGAAFSVISRPAG